MTPEMDRIRQGYLERLRFSLRGASRDVAADILREIDAHIQDAVAARPEPSVANLLDVLERLGAPEIYGPEQALYQMTDRGYREWSLPYMARSTLFWALSTVAGATVVSLFAALFALAGLLVVLGTAEVVGVVPLGWSGLSSWLRRPDLWIVAGLGMALGLVATIRWFVGQYVRSAHPDYAGGVASPDWVTRTTRRILGIAATGFAAAAGGGVVAGILSLSSPGRGVQWGAFRSPAGIVAAIGLAVLLLSPVLGLLLSQVVEGKGDRT
jgi:hypothetical protein